MAIKHIPDGEEFFGGNHGEYAQMKDFGFSKSVNTPTRDSSRTGPSNVSRPGEMGNEFAEGGSAHHEGVPGYAGGGHMHPHGHHVAHVEHMGDGSVKHHHSHGGYTMHHAHGGISHHMHDGMPAMASGGEMHTSDGMPTMAEGGHMHPDGHNVSRMIERAGGGHMECHAHGGMTVHHPDGRITHHDSNGMPVSHGEAAGMIKSGMRQHENAEHSGNHEELHLARGGIGHRVRLPRGMKPTAMRPHSPIETPPRNPTKSVTPSNLMPGGQAPYGVQPSDEPDMAGADQNIPQLKGGGHMRHRR